MAIDTQFLEELKARIDAAIDCVKQREWQASDEMLEEMKRVIGRHQGDTEPSQMDLNKSAFEQ
jgi:hypothetical protein